MKAIVDKALEQTQTANDYKSPQIISYSEKRTKNPQCCKTVDVIKTTMNKMMQILICQKLRMKQFSYNLYRDCSYIKLLLRINQ